MNPPGVIRVTADHIRDGERGTVWGCPIALAILDEFSGTDKDDLDIEAAVDMNFAALRISGRELTADLPRLARDFIWELDHGRPVAPLEFAVEWTDEDGVGV